MRIFLFLVTNFAVLMAAGLVISLLTSLGVIPPMESGSYLTYLVLAAALGMGGSFISLLMSKTMAKRSVRAQVIDQPRNDVEAWLISTVKDHAERAGIGMPEVAIFPSNTMNAFATGAKKDAALVAVSSGLLNGMTRDEAEAVIGHEISHIANGDMITLSLIQGVMNTFVIFVSSIIASIIVAQQRGSDRRGGFMMQMMIRQMLMVAFGWLASIVVAWFSRRREYRADEGGAGLTSTGSMANALRRLQTSEPPELPASLNAFGINGRGLAALLSTHPPIEQRIARLEAQAHA